MREERSPRASRVGERLRATREEIGLPLDELGACARVPMRHLVAIEDGDFASLPAVPYSVCFVRAYAGAVGIEGADLARDFRAEMTRAGDAVARPEPRPFGSADPSRLPPQWLAAVAALLALLLVIGFGIWRGGMGHADGARLAAGPDTALSTAAAAARPAAAAKPVAAPASATTPVPPKLRTRHRRRHHHGGGA